MVFEFFLQVVFLTKYFFFLYFIIFFFYMLYGRAFYSFLSIQFIEKFLNERKTLIFGLLLRKSQEKNQKLIFGKFDIFLFFRKNWVKYIELQERKKNHFLIDICCTLYGF